MTTFDKKSRYHGKKSNADNRPIDAPDRERHAEKIHIKKEQRYSGYGESDGENETLEAINSMYIVFFV